MPLNRASSQHSSRLGGREIINLALLLSFPVIALDQFLRTPVAQLLAQPAVQAQHWVTDSLMMLPLFAAGIWAGDRIARRAALFNRAVVIVLCVAIALIPVWFERNKKDNLIHAQALVTPHSRGGDDVYWVASAVILALVCVSLVPAAAWAGRVLASRVLASRVLASRAMAGRLAPWARTSVPVLLVACVPVAAWLLHNAAEHAYASQVNYTSALLSAPVRSHAFFGGGHGPGKGAPVTAAPFAFLDQTAHALQDGLAGQAAGLPVASIALLWGARADARSRHVSKGGTEDERARPD
jgi:hypothetical protein